MREDRPDDLKARLEAAARSLSYATIALGNNDVSEALSELAEVCFTIAAVCETLASPPQPTRLN